MIEIKEKSMCAGCGACAMSCPKNCISMEADSEGFLYPRVNKDSCINCGLCERVCPFLNPSETKVLKAYGFNTLDDEIRRESSSGGAFSAFSQYILDRGGVVFGVELSSDCRHAEFTAVTDKNELYRLRKSKYMQADTGDSFKQALNYLNEGREVLFTGTPCQINGLKKFLNKDFENLICADIVCHGAPSEKLWNRYVDYMNEKPDGKISSVNFRCKKNGWKQYGIEIKKENNSTVLEERAKNPYISMFLDDYCLRPSCYDCKAKGNNLSDITMGDFWGIDNVLSEMNDDKGSSLIIVRTAKGRRLLEAIENNALIKETEYEKAVSYNPAEFKSVERPQKRQNFYEDLNNESFERMIKLYATEPLKERIKDNLRKTALWQGIRKLRK